MNHLDSEDADKQLAWKSLWKGEGKHFYIFRTKKDLPQEIC